MLTKSSSFQKRLNDFFDASAQIKRVEMSIIDADILASRPLLAKKASLEPLLVRRSDCLRSEVEDFIKQTFHDNYGARPSSFPSKLITVISESGDISCAAGLRSEEDGFFSECYFDFSIEDVIFQKTGVSVDRAGLLEVSTLASCSPKNIVPFITKIVDYGESAGFDWAFFTLTQRLKLLLRRMGLDLVLLGRADIACVSDPERWGSYYRTNPFVYAVARRDLDRLCHRLYPLPVHA